MVGDKNTTKKKNERKREETERGEREREWIFVLFSKREKWEKEKRELISFKSFLRASPCTKMDFCYGWEVNTKHISISCWAMCVLLLQIKMRHEKKWWMGDEWISERGCKGQTMKWEKEALFLPYFIVIVWRKKKQVRLTHFISLLSVSLPLQTRVL